MKWRPTFKSFRFGRWRERERKSVSCKTIFRSQIPRSYCYIKKPLKYEYIENEFEAIHKRIYFRIENFEKRSVNWFSFFIQLRLIGKLQEGRNYIYKFVKFAPGWLWLGSSFFQKVLSILLLFLTPSILPV